MSEGVWAVIESDYGDSIARVYPEEIDALRRVNEQGYGRAQFIPWGKDLYEIKEGTNAERGGE